MRGLRKKYAEIEEAKLALARKAVRVQQERNEMLRILIKQIEKVNLQPH